MGAIFITLFFSKEYPPQEYQEYHGKPEKSNGSLLDIFTDFKNMPKTMKQLGLVQFFSWFALFSMWVFTTDAVATHIYGLTGDYTNSVEYNEAGNKVSSAFGVYSLVSMFYALCLPFIAKWIGKKMTHSVSLLAGGIGLISIYFIKDPEMLNYAMIGVGLAWASILAMPYVLLSGSIPAGKLGIYMGIFNFFITLPQIINGFVGGSIVKYIYAGQPIYALLMAGVFLILAAISVVKVYDPTSKK
jgi:maltose/moltooligosaccharide transporter